MLARSLTAASCSTSSSGTSTSSGSGRTSSWAFSRKGHASVGTPMALGRVQMAARSCQGLAVVCAKGFGATTSKGFGAPKTAKVSTTSTRAPLLPGKVSGRLPVPPSILRPPYADSGKVTDKHPKPQIHDEEGIAKMRASGNLAARVLAYGGSLVRPGITTDAIDRAVHEMIVSAGAYPSPLNYSGFPKSVCTSVNECVCHGIPDSRALEDGDIINIDVTVYLDGYHGDCSSMFFAGAVSPSAKRLCAQTLEALEAGIAVCKPGAAFREIGAAINEVADRHKIRNVSDFVGHGVGQVFHAPPMVQHERNNQPGVMKVGQTFTIEPMMVAGSPAVKMWADKWTAVTRDGSLAAQYEHTLLITPTGVEILTKC